MGKAAATKKTTTAEDEVQQYMQVLNAKRMFLSATSNMSWRLVVTVVVPIVAGVKIDDHFHTAPNFTLTGIILAATAGCMTVWNVVKEVTAEQDEETKNVISPKRNKHA